MKDKNKKSIKCLQDVIEYTLHAFSKNGFKTTDICNLTEFAIITDMLKAIIDNQLDIPNELADKIEVIKKDLDLDINKRLH
jgi:hypothetical protein